MSSAPSSAAAEMHASRLRAASSVGARDGDNDEGSELARGAGLTANASAAAHISTSDVITDAARMGTLNTAGDDSPRQPFTVRRPTHTYAAEFLYQTS